MPISTVLLNQYNAKIVSEKINGFAGSQTAKEVEMIRDYVNGIAAGCNTITSP